MVNNMDSTDRAVEKGTWQLNALTEALGDLTLTINDSLSVGRGNDNDVVLGSKEVSRNHAVLSTLNGQLYVKDLDSSNGTFINDERIEGNKSSLLQVDDTIGFASFSFQVVVPTADADANPEIEALSPVMADDSASSINAGNEEPIIEEPIIEEPIIEEPIIEEPIVEEPIVEEPIVEEPIVEEPIVEEPIVEEPIVEEPIVEEPIIEEPIIEEPIVEEPIVEEPIVEEPIVEEPIVEEPIVEEPIVEEPIVEEPIVEEPIVEESVVKKTDIEALLPAKDSVAPAPTASAANESLVEQPIVHEEPAPVVQPEHDKTTKTELQEEADPDVLRAKQAATAQFSGTANLGQSRDLGTEGNNAMDQAIDNPANAGQVEKKPSGGWFIWLFVAIIIIGLALWLFNMGGA